MFTVTDSAIEELEAFFAGKEKAPIRIYLAAGGCSGPRLALALDSARESDETFTERGFEFCMESDLYARAGDVVIDAGYMGFNVQSSEPLAPAGSGCSGCGGGCASV